MKYIRTADGKILKHPHSNDEVFTSRYEIIKSADTIEELCDEFVCVRKRDNKHFYTEDKKIFDYWYLDKDFVYCDFYGTVWTNKGLIYVAKMNKKGELELI